MTRYMTQYCQADTEYYFMEETLMGKKVIMTVKEKKQIINALKKTLKPGPYRNKKLKELKKLLKQVK